MKEVVKLRVSIGCLFSYNIFLNKNDSCCVFIGAILEEQTQQPTISGSVNHYIAIGNNN